MMIMVFEIVFFVCGVLWCACSSSWEEAAFRGFVLGGAVLVINHLSAVVNVLIEQLKMQLKMKNRR